MRPENMLKPLTDKCKGNDCKHRKCSCGHCKNYHIGNFQCTKMFIKTNKNGEIVDGYSCKCKKFVETVTKAEAEFDEGY